MYGSKLYNRHIFHAMFISCTRQEANMDKIDYKKTEKHLYLPKNLAIVEVP